MTPCHLVARAIAALSALILLAFVAPSAQARVDVHFHSFNGSMFAGRYPHTFVVFDGQIDGTGERIYENYGFSAQRATPAVLRGPVPHIVMTEKEKHIGTTNRHFTLTVSDETYRRLKAEVIAWRDAPGRFYDLNTRNCIHFVGRLAELAGLRVDYPPELLRKPRAWLNHVGQMNPQIVSRQF